MNTLAPLEGGSDIEIGTHVEGHWLGMTWNLDTIWSTLIAGGIVLLLGFIARRALTKDSEDHVPTKIQLMWEAVVNQVNTQVEENLGRIHPFVAPLAIALFFFILFANWLELLPTEFVVGDNHIHLTPAPTADTNLTYAMALLVMVSVWIYGMQQQGVGGYFKHFFANGPLLAPLNILEELIKPVTLALRLFGNIFAGGIMLALIGLIPFYGLWVPNLVWKLFDMFIGGIQAFIFALLTVLYFSMAGAGHGHDEEHEHAEEHEPASEKTPDKTPQPAAV